jgi:2-dehydropantoate 2-reductase
MTSAPASPRILVVGAGGVGGYYAARVFAHGADVAVVARGDNLRAIREHGLRVRSGVDGEWVARLEAISPEELPGRAPPDWIWIATKAYDTPAIVETIRPLVGSQTLVTSLQNGVENEEILARAFGRERVLGAMTVLIGARLVEPGVIEHVGESRFVFGEYPRGESARSAALADFLVRHGVRAVLSNDVEAELWRKLMINDALNGLSALTRLDTNTLTNDPATAELVRRMMAEVHAVATRRGVPLPEDEPDRLIAMLRGFDGIRTSMLHDVEHGRPTEVEAIVGIVVRGGRELRIPTPLNDVVYALVSAMDRRRAAEAMR